MQKRGIWQRLSGLSRHDFNQSGAYLIGLLIVAIYVSTASAIVVSCLVGVWWLITGEFKQLPVIFKTSPVAAGAMVLYLCFFIGLGYGQVPDDAAYSTIRKYRELSYIPVLSCFFIHERYRTIAWKAFLVASVISLAGSFLMDLGVMEMQRNKSFSLKSRITHSIFIAFFIYYCAHKVTEIERRHKIWFYIAALIGIFNLFFVVEGRTGQLIFIILAPLFAVQRFGKKGLLTVIIGVICFMGLFINYSDKSSRIRYGLTNTFNYWHQDDIKKPVDVGVRFKYWQHSMTLIAEKPLLGYGTGSFEDQYKRLSGDKRGLQNPHNEFLLITIQLGLLGFISYCGFMFSQFYSARSLRQLDKWLAQGLLLTLIVTSLFNSPLLDHAEGHWFAVLLALCHAASRVKVNPGSKDMAVTGYHI